MENLTSVSCQMRSEVQAVRKSQLNERHENVFSQFKETDRPFFDFARLIMNHMPFSLINFLQEKDLVEFYRYLYSNVNDRKKKKFHIASDRYDKLPFFLGKFSVFTLVTNDRPFIFDSIWGYFTEKRFRQQYMLHPILGIKRDRAGDIIAVEETTSDTKNESVIILFLDDLPQPQIDELSADFTKIYEDLLVAVDDFDLMSRSMNELASSYREKMPDMEEFIRWMMGGNFIFQGIRVVDLNLKTAEGEAKDYGIFKNLKVSPNYRTLAESIQNRTLNFVESYPVEVEKSRLMSVVKRRRAFNRLIFFDERGGSCRVVTVLGLFTQDGVKAPPHEISLLRKRVQQALSHFNFVHGSHDYKWIRDILDRFPKTELFTFDSQVLIEILDLILSIQGTNQIRICYRNFAPRKNLFFFITIPAERYSSELVNRLNDYLCNYFKATTLDIAVRQDEHRSFFLHFHLLVDNIDIFKTTSDEHIKEGVISLMKRWDERLYDLLRTRSGDISTSLFDQAKESFSESYRAKSSPDEAYWDVVSLNDLQGTTSRVYSKRNKAVLKIYSRQKYLLTELMPMIDHTGLKVSEEDIHSVTFEGVESFIHAVYLAGIDDTSAFAYDYRTIIPDLVTAILEGKVESDILNSLTVSERLTWRQIDILRTLRNMIRQYEETFLVSTLNRALTENSKIATLLVRYFETKFDPEMRERNLEAIESQILDLVEKVPSVSIDKALRSYLQVLKGIVRTNFYVQPMRPYISVKVQSGTVDIIKKPKPLFEIYVHSAHMEGVHLRGGKIARGGLRFSDRMDDFRTEVLGLVKAQMVKNAVIVPQGSKGGFIVKKRFADREQDQKNIVAQYSTFISGLLDITDNYNKKGAIVQPKRVVTYDDKDPYLVVAADKGTATFSDIANSISLKYGFWLGDAFASGGSTGYDHKKVGITAAGAWECVKRHFRELGKDIQKEEFTVAGIGDMSGDVFGNGMLLSKKILLLAAFNHMHIFIDPTPDSALTYQERLRLFRKPRSVWSDYTADIISEGGGIFERSAKRIPLSPQMKEMFHTNVDVMTGEEIVREILKMKVELLWNGGIGTYVKASTETNADAGDATNDNVRISATELRAKVVGEGGNLGFTQLARIEFSKKGGLINTDALDNSGGVDMSDHEVNIKILLDRIQASGKIKTTDDRNKAILDLTGAVTDLVLRDNYKQSQVISCDLFRYENNPVSFREAANFLRKRGLLDFRLEHVLFASGDAEITRPELAVLLAYSKIFLKQELESTIDLDNPLYLKQYLAYYPNWILENYEEDVLQHPLRRQITVTSVVNRIVNNAGSTFFMELARNLHAPIPKLVENYMFATHLMGTKEIRDEIDALDNKAFASAQYHAYTELEKTLKVAIEWLLDSEKRKLVEENIDMFRDIVWMLPSQLPKELKDNYNTMVDTFVDAGFPKKLAKKIADFRYAKPAFDVFETSMKLGVPYQDVIKRYFEVGYRLKVPTITVAMKVIRIKNEWERVNREALLRRLKELQKGLTEQYSKNDEKWFKRLQVDEVEFFNYHNTFIESLEAGEIDSLVPFNVMVDALAQIV